MRPWHRSLGQLFRLQLSPLSTESGDLPRAASSRKASEALEGQLVSPDRMLGLQGHSARSMSVTTAASQQWSLAGHSVISSPHLESRSEDWGAPDICVEGTTSSDSAADGAVSALK